MANIYQGVGNPRDFDEVQYGTGDVGRKVAGGWKYDWRADPYQDVLSDQDVVTQKQLQGFRDSNPGGVAEDDPTAWSQMQGQTALKNAPPAQQWNAQPAPAGPGQGQQGSNDLFSLLMQRAQQPTTVGRNDPNVRAQADAYSANTERGKRNYLADVAEKQGPLANIAGETRLANERAGQANAGFEAELMGRETSARREEIQQALSQWGAQLSDQQRMQLQRELGYLGDSTQRAGLAQQNTQFNTSQNNNMEQFLRELALRENNQNNLWDYNWATLGL